MTAEIQNQEARVIPRRQVERLIALLGAYASEVLTGHLLLEATGGELTPAQLDALSFIHRHGKCSAKALSEGLRISIPSSTRLVDRLVRKHLVVRREHDEDRRLVELTATPAGAAFLATVRDTRIQRVELALRQISPEEQETLLELLERFVLAALCDQQTVDECCRHCGSEHDGDCVVNEAHIALRGRPIDHP